MIKTILLLAMTYTLASAWFFPKMEFGYSNDEKHQNVDKSFVRDNEKEVVLNTKMNKMYYDAQPMQRMHFFKAWDHCKNFDFLGHNDWRVPSKDELRDLLELSRPHISAKHAFTNILEEKYWTSTDSRFEEAYYIDFDLGRYSTDKQKKKYRVICVRDLK